MKVQEYKDWLAKVEPRVPEWEAAKANLDNAFKELGKLSEELGIPYSLNMGFESVDIGYGPKKPVYCYDESELIHELRDQGLDGLEARDLAESVFAIVGNVYNPNRYTGWWSSVSCQESL